MAYAVFKEGVKLSRSFPTREEALRKADEAGLVEDADGKPALEGDLRIQPCAPDSETNSDDDLDWSPKKDVMPV
jgi:hypothetical protein